MRRRAALLLLVAVVAAAIAAGALLPRTRRALAARRFHRALTDVAPTIYLTEAQRQQLRAAGPEQSEPPPFRWQAVWAVPGDRFLTLEGTIAGIIPTPSAFYGVTSHAKVFDATGELVWRRTFFFPVYNDSSELREVPGIDVPVLLIAKQVGRENGVVHALAITERDAVLVRVEDGLGGARRNRYAGLDAALGPAVPDWSESDWEAAARSTDRVEVLRALVWLGGEEVSWSPVRDERERLRARVRAGLADRWDELLRAKDPWIADAALLAKEPGRRDRPLADW